MSKPISVGDSVVIVGYVNSNCAEFIGTIKTIASESEINPGYWLLDPPTISRETGWRISWSPRHLKRLDPDALLDDTPTDERLTV